jgi:hypothetical protein
MLRMIASSEGEEVFARPAPFFGRGGGQEDTEGRRHSPLVQRRCRADAARNPPGARAADLGLDVNPSSGFRRNAK